MLAKGWAVMELEVTRTIPNTDASSGRLMPCAQRSGLFQVRRFLPRVLLAFVVLLLTGCPPEERYVVTNFLGEDIQVQSTDGAISVRSSEAVTIRTYEHVFELDKAGHSLLKIKSGRGRRCFVLDISSYGVDTDTYYGSEPRPTLQIVLLPEGDAYAIPYSHSAMAEVQSGKIKDRPRFRQCPGPGRIARD